MIVVSLYGGLGNQLFQYAAARSLSSKLGCELSLDLAWFNIVDSLSNTTARKYALGPFQLQAKLQYDGLGSTKFKSRILRVLFKLFQKSQKSLPVYSERGAAYQKDFAQIEWPVWLNGYWQSSRYFDGISDLIRHEIGTPRDLNEQSQRMYKQIQLSDSVCVHIRRGDYVTNKNASETHGLCSLDYYYRGINLVSTKVKNPICYVFSDDPLWVQDHFKPAIPVVLVDINGPEDAHQDLWLMSACKHFVIANSSLSWWGAWLSVNPKKIVVAPANWYADRTMDVSDLIPKDWVRI